MTSFTDGREVRHRGIGMDLLENERGVTAPRKTGGFTMIEVMVVLAIVGVIVASAAPNVNRFFETNRGRAAAKSVADAFNIARAQAIRTGNNHIVFFSVGPASDTGGNGLTDPHGSPVPILVLNDGAPGSALQNCLIDAGEQTLTFDEQIGVGFGSNTAPTPAPNDDDVTAIPAAGSSFRAPNGAPNMSWVQFRPDGVPVAIDNACDAGRLGTGGGTIYVQTANRDFAITLSPLGSVRVHVWDVSTGQWTS